MKNALPAQAHAVPLTPTVPARAAPLRIQVSAAHDVETQARAYAEYRLFEGLAPVAGVRSARVSLRPIRGREGAVSCSVLIVHDDGRRFRLRATGTHTYQAINRVSERVSALAAEDAAPPA